nr:hypothetical protein Iba_chr11cCG8320 [Ipomoea batatas]GMD55368.1 hypothetical protein Iba_chr11dCG7280 [Ipomoea batatas]
MSLCSTRSIGLVLSFTGGFKSTSGSSVVHGRPCAIGTRSLLSSSIICFSLFRNSSSLHFPLCCILRLNGLWEVALSCLLFWCLLAKVPDDPALLRLLFLPPSQVLPWLLSSEWERCEFRPKLSEVTKKSDGPNGDEEASVSGNSHLIPFLVAATSFS